MLRLVIVGLVLLSTFGLSACATNAPAKTSLKIVALNESIGESDMHLNCQPQGGDLSSAKTACSALASDPGLLTHPKPFTCAGGPFSWWDVRVTGRLNGKPLTRSFSTCWTPQMALIGRLGLSWKVLNSHLIARRIKTVAPNTQQTFAAGVLRPTDLVTCTIAGHKLGVGVPEVANLSSGNGYGGDNVKNVELDVARLPDGSVMASCHYGMTPPAPSFIKLAMDSSAGKAWGLSELFSNRLDTKTCVIHGGGPAPGIRVPGTCSTVVLPGDGHSATVRFIETWKAKNFRGPRSGKRKILSHIYELVVSTRGLGADRVLRSRDYGDFPPQMAM